MPYRLLTVLALPRRAQPDQSQFDHAFARTTASYQSKIYTSGRLALLYLLYISIVNNLYNMFCKLFSKDKPLCELQRVEMLVKTKW